MEVFYRKIKINDDGSIRFVDKKDQEAFQKTLLFLKEKKGVDTVGISISTIEDESTERQRKLFIVLCKKISQESSQYSFEHVLNAFLAYFGFTDLNTITKEEYNNLLEFSVSMSNELFNVNVSINPDTHHVEII